MYCCFCPNLRCESEDISPVQASIDGIRCQHRQESVLRLDADAFSLHICLNVWVCGGCLLWWRSERCEVILLLSLEPQPAVALVASLSRYKSVFCCSHQTKIVLCQNHSHSTYICSDWLCDRYPISKVINCLSRLSNNTCWCQVWNSKICLFLRVKKGRCHLGQLSDETNLH